MRMGWVLTLGVSTRRSVCSTPLDMWLRSSIGLADPAALQLRMATAKMEKMSFAIADGRVEVDRESMMVNATC